MSRTFEPITQSELLTKIKKAAEPLMDEGHNPGLPTQVWHLLEEGMFDNDLKVNVDFENFECETGKGYNGCIAICGPQSVNTGLVFVGCTAGGDWEVPVFFIIYWDGKKLRAYVPTDGNTWNTDTKAAYGNNARADYENVKKRYPDLGAEIDEKIANDRESWKQLKLPGDYFEFDVDLFPECDPVKILVDIEQRITKRGDEAAKIDMPPVCDGFKLTRSGNFIVLQTTLNGDVKGAGIMMTIPMATKLAFDLIKNSDPAEAPK